MTTAGATSEVTIAGATDADAIQQNSSCDQLLWRDRDARLRRTPAQTFCLTTLPGEALPSSGAVPTTLLALTQNDRTRLIYQAR